MRERAPAVLAAGTVIALVVALAVPPAAGHDFGVTAGDQVSADGTVTIETVQTLDPAFVVVHRNDGGDLGAPVGHRQVTTPGEHRAVEVSLSESFWSAVDGNVSLQAAVHPDDGDGTFEPDDDPVATRSGTPVADRFSVRPGPGEASVVADRQTVKGEVTVRRVALPGEGFLVLHVDDGGDLGRPVGHRALGVGVHRNTTVPLNDSFYADQSGRFGLWAVVHADDGDGTFEPGTDAPVRVGGGAVRSFLSVGKVKTPVPLSTASPTPTPSPTVTATPTATDPAPTTTTASPTPTPGDGAVPGFGGAAAVAALAVLVGARLRR